LPQGYKHSPMIGRAALAELLQTVSLPQDVKLYKYIDDILIGGTAPEKVGEVAGAVKIEQLQMPQFRKELQQLMSTLVYWRKHIPGFSIIAHPLYSVL
ncbi:hypothetical protein FQV20_0008183, partial [Eudyptula albosignata]